MGQSTNKNEDETVKMLTQKSYYLGNNVMRSRYLI